MGCVERDREWGGEALQTRAPPPASNMIISQHLFLSRSQCQHLPSWHFPQAALGPGVQQVISGPYERTTGLCSREDSSPLQLRSLSRTCAWRLGTEGPWDPHASARGLCREKAAARWGGVVLVQDAVGSATGNPLPAPRGVEHGVHCAGLCSGLLKISLTEDAWPPDSRSEVTVMAAHCWTLRDGRSRLCVVSWVSRSGDPSGSCLLGPGLCTAQHGRGNAPGLRSGGPGLRFWPQKTPTLPFPLGDLVFLSRKDKCVAGRRGKALDPWPGRERGVVVSQERRPHGLSEECTGQAAGRPHGHPGHCPCRPLSGQRLTGSSLR